MIENKFCSNINLEINEKQKSKDVIKILKLITYHIILGLEVINIKNA